MDLRKAAMLSFTLIAAGAATRWVWATRRKQRLLGGNTAAPVVAKDKLVAVLKALDQPAGDAVNSLMLKSQTCRSDAERREIMDSARKLLEEAMEEPQSKVLKDMGVTVDEVTDAYKHYSSKRDEEVTAAALPIKRRIGALLLDPPTCLAVLQAISDSQCENMSTAVKRAAEVVPPSPTSMEAFMGKLRQTLSTFAEEAAQAEMGVSVQQVMMRVQGHCKADPTFQKSVQEIMSAVDAASQQALMTLQVS